MAIKLLDYYDDGMQNVSELLQWSQQNFSTLYWRKNRSIYLTLVSEVMLQQTTVSTVAARIHSFMSKFPSMSDLAQANVEEVVKEWQGLGYYQRARRLHNTAIYLMRENQGNIPLDLNLLQRVPGIGPYTASALLAIGANLPYLAIDVNVIRVFMRLMGPDILGVSINSQVAQVRQAIESYFQLKLRNKISNFTAFNEALMDVGRVYCQANKKECLHCPLRMNCYAKKLTLLQDPWNNWKKNTSKKKVSSNYQLKLARFVIMQKNAIMLVQRKKGTWLEGQWELPTLIMKTNNDKFQQYEYGNISLTKELEQLHRSHQNVFEIKSSITQYKILNIIFSNKISSNQYWHSKFQKKIQSEINHKFKESKFIPTEQLDQLALSSVTLKILAKILH